MQKSHTVFRFGWFLVCIVAGTMIGAAIGWQKHGLVGAIVLGFVGMVTGAFLGSSFSSALQFLS